MPTLSFLHCLQVDEEDGFQSMKPGPDSLTGLTSNLTCVTSCSQNGEQTLVLQFAGIDSQSKITRDLEEISL